MPRFMLARRMPPHLAVRYDSPYSSPEPDIPPPSESSRSSVTVSPPVTRPPSPAGIPAASHPEEGGDAVEVIYIPDDTPTRPSSRDLNDTATASANNRADAIDNGNQNENAIENANEITADAGVPHMSPHLSLSPVIKRRRTNRSGKREDVDLKTQRAVPLDNAKPFTAEEEEGNTCSICLEPWTNSGPHQVCSTKCGHLFGYSCIEEWIKVGGRRSRGTCPSCKNEIRVKQLRYVFGLPSRLSTADAHLSESLRSQLEEEREAHRRTKEKLRKKHETTTALRASIRELSAGKANSSGVRTFGDAVPRPAHQLKALTFCNISVDTQATTFDTEARLLIPEKMTQGRSARYRLKRIHVARPLFPSVSTMMFSKKVTDLSVCTAENSSHYRYIAASVHTRTMEILAPDLQLATTIRTPSVPTRSCWLSSNPHALAVGFTPGFVCTYDIRFPSGGPLYQSDIDSNGWRLVHSLAEVPVGRVNDGGKALLAGAPKGLYAARLDGSWPPRFEKVGGLEEGRVCGFSMAGGLMAVTLCKASEGASLAIYKGLRKTDNKLEVGEMLGTPKGGLCFESVFVPVGIVGGDADGRDATVVCPDSFASPGIACWGFVRTDDGSLAWRPLEVDGTCNQQGDTFNCRAALAFSMPRNARMGGLPTNCKSLFGCYSEDRINIYSCGQHGSHLQA